MPLPLIVAGVSAGISALSSVFGAVKASKAQKKAEKQARKSRKEMNRLKSVYSNLDTSNPYLNMENTMEDLTVNQSQAQFQAEQSAQSQANILNSFRGAAGGSGIAGLAQTMAQQGQLNAQKASISIGRQEQANQLAMAQEAKAIQNAEIGGEVASRALERDQVGTMLGMSQAETAANRQQAAAAEQAKYNAIAGGVGSLTSLTGSAMEAGLFDKPVG